MAVLSSCCAESGSVVPGRTSGCGCAMNGCRRSSPVVVCVGVGRVGLNTGALPPPPLPSPLPLLDTLHLSVSVIIPYSVATKRRRCAAEKERWKKTQKKSRTAGKEKEDENARRHSALHMKKQIVQKRGNTQTHNAFLCFSNSLIMYM